jgi:hypothetical protein
MFHAAFRHIAGAKDKGTFRTVCAWTRLRIDRFVGGFNFLLYFKSTFGEGEKEMAVVGFLTVEEGFQNDGGAEGEGQVD